MTQLITSPHDAQVARLLAAAEELFYARGVQAVGMDQIRTSSGISLKRIYQLFRTKSDLVVAVLDRRDAGWRGRLEEFVNQRPESERVCAIFDWLQNWFTTPGFRGCAWINVFGELGGTDPAVVQAVQAHKRAFHDFITHNVGVNGFPAALAPGVCLLAEGAIINASIGGDAAQASVAGDAALRLLAAAS